MEPGLVGDKELWFLLAPSNLGFPESDILASHGPNHHNDNTLQVFDQV